MKIDETCLKAGSASILRDVSSVQIRLHVRPLPMKWANHRHVRCFLRNALKCFGYCGFGSCHEDHTGAGVIQKREVVRCIVVAVGLRRLLPSRDNIKDGVEGRAIQGWAPSGDFFGEFLLLKVDLAKALQTPGYRMDIFLT